MNNLGGNSMTLAAKTKGKSERLEARVNRTQKALFKQAAEIQGTTLSDFIVQAASEAATRIVENHRVITLTAEESAVVAKALLNPRKPSRKLRAAADRYDKIMGR
jgi:uncharacterized protein (DUF1778 family)